MCMHYVLLFLHKLLLVWERVKYQRDMVEMWEVFPWRFRERKTKIVVFYILRTANRRALRKKKNCKFDQFEEKIFLTTDSDVDKWIWYA